MQVANHGMLRSGRSKIGENTFCYNKKPALCSPQHLPCLSYSTREELEYIMSMLIVNNKPTKTYLDLLYTQRQWLYRVGTTEARALNILRVLNGVLK